LIIYLAKKNGEETPFFLNYIILAYIMPGMPPIPPMPPISGIAGAADSSCGISVTMASVVIIIPATEPAA
jgi:hypothetical protein